MARSSATAQKPKQKKKRKKISELSSGNKRTSDDNERTAAPLTGSLLMSSIFGNSSDLLPPTEKKADEREESPARREKLHDLSLMSSIFGNGSDDHDSRRASSITAVVGDQRGSSLSSSTKTKKRKNEDTTESISGFNLFSSSTTFQKASRNRQKEIREKHQKFLQLQQQAKLPKSRDAILQRRRKRTQTTCDLVSSVTVDIRQYYEQGNQNEVADSDAESEEDDVDRGVARLLVGRCSALFRHQGVLILESLLSARKSSHSSSTLMQNMQSKARDVKAKICLRLDEKLGKDSYRPKQHHQAMGSETRDDDRSFRFVEVASRCLGRLDVRYRMNEEPFSDLHLPSCSLSDYAVHAASSSSRNYDNGVVKLLWPLVQDLLGKDAELVYMGLIYSFPGSEDQPWHQDGCALFPDAPADLTNSLPPYALNVFIPLLDVTEELGPTEFWLGSHNTDQAHNFLSKKESRQVEDPDDDMEEGRMTKIIAPLVSVGDALIYDYRICHRGTSNLSASQTTRPMLYLMYARPWFKEHLNFGNEHLFDPK